MPKPPRDELLARALGAARDYAETIDGARPEDDAAPQSPEPVEPQAAANGHQSVATSDQKADPPEDDAVEPAGNPDDPRHRLRALRQENESELVDLHGVLVPRPRSADTVWTFSFRMPESYRDAIAARCRELRISHQEFGRLAVDLLLAELAEG